MCGLPTFVRSGTGASEMVEEGLSGKTFSSNRIEDLKTQISDFVLGKLKFNFFEIQRKQVLLMELKILARNTSICTITWNHFK